MTIFKFYSMKSSERSIQTFITQKNSVSLHMNRFYRGQLKYFSTNSILEYQVKKHGYQHFLLFPQCFQKISSSESFTQDYVVTGKSQTGLGQGIIFNKHGHSFQKMAAVRALVFHKHILYSYIINLELQHSMENHVLSKTIPCRK